MNSWEKYFDLGARLSFEKKFSESIQAFKKSIALHENWDTYRGLGSALYHIENLKHQ